MSLKTARFVLGIVFRGIDKRRQEMGIKETILRKPSRIARTLVSMYKDEAEEIVYRAGNIAFEEKQILLQNLKSARIQLFNLRGYEV